jgi:hypothetical protein
VLQPDIGIAHFKGDLCAPRVHVAIGHEEPGRRGRRVTGTVENVERRRLGAAGVDEA